jgi:DNA replication and repair protein RecF
VYIESISFRNFRNYELLKLEFSPNINLIVGGNAQGKTNILEGIYFLSTAKSHRTSMDTELIQNSKDWFYLKGRVFSRNSSTEVEIINACDEKKKVKIDGKAQNKISSIIGKINTVMFSPEDLSLVKGSPSERRRFLDILISRIDPTYLHDILEYQSALKQRNELLKKIKEQRASKSEGKPDSSVDTLDSWNSLLAKSGSEVVRKRLTIIPELSELAMDKHWELTLSKEKLDIEYQSQLIKSSVSDNQIYEIFQKNLNKNIDSDIRLGTTTTGPHRDDLIFTIDGMDIRKFCSQGQQRTTVLSLKLATLELMYKRLDEYPIILLDDVTSELDDSRVSLLFSLLSKIPAQTLLTTTGLNELWSNGLDTWLSRGVDEDCNGSHADICIFIVDNGSVRDGNAEYKDSFRKHAGSTGSE